MEKEENFCELLSEYQPAEELEMDHYRIETVKENSRVPELVTVKKNPVL